MLRSLTRKQTAEAMQVSVRKVDYLRSSGELPHVKIGNCVRFLMEDIEAYLQRHRVALVPVVAKEK